MAEQLDIETLFKLKVEELKLELGKRNLTKSGTKADLQERLLQYVNTHQSTVINYEIGCSADPTEDEEKLKDELEESLDKPEMIIENLVGTKYLNEDIIDSIPTPNDDNISITNNDGDNDDNVDDDDDDDDIIGVKNVVKKNSVMADNSIDSITAIEGTDTNCIHSGKTDKPKVFSAKTISLLTTSTEKKENRGKRFGGPSSETEKKKARLGRFFSSVSGLGKGEPVTAEDEEKIKKRVERFGAVSTILMPDSSSDRLKVRQERFADVNIKKRQERFGVVHKQISDLNSDMEVRKQQRLLKFGALD